MSVVELWDSLDKDWQNLLQDECQKSYFQSLDQKLSLEYQEHQIYPPTEQLFTAFELCPPATLSVVLLGQDPYHGSGQAEGLSFSVPQGQKIPPSLRNIHRELHYDMGIAPPTHGSLRAWAKQGVLLLNSLLSVRHNSPGSHKGLGWERFSDAIIAALSQEKEHLVFLLWGKFAQNKSSLIDSSKHLVLESSHPSPFSAHRGFLGSKPFSTANAYLDKHGQRALSWTL